MLVVTKDSEQNFSRGARREEDVIDIKVGRVVGDEVAGFVSFELKAAAEGAGFAAEVAEGEFGVVVEEDAILERCLYLGSNFEFYAADLRFGIFESADVNLQTEADFEGAIAGSFLLEFDFTVIVDGEVDLGDGDVFLRVEVVGELLMTEDLFAKGDALAGIDAGESAGLKWSSTDGYRLCREVFEDEKLMVAEGQHALGAVQAFEGNIGVSGRGPEAHAFERGLASFQTEGVGVFAGADLANDIESSFCHAQLGHEGMKIDELSPVFSGSSDKIVELDAEHDFLIGVELAGEFLSHDSDVMLFMERFAEERAEFGINCFWEIMPEKTEGGIDFLFEHLGAAFGESGEHLDEQREKIGALGDGAWTAGQPSGGVLDLVPSSVNQRDLVPRFPEAGAEFAQKAIDDEGHGVATESKWKGA